VAAPVRRRREELRSSACHLALWLLRDGRFAHAAEEEGLVDSTVEDGDTQLDAFGDDVAPFETGFTGKLGGRQVIRHTFRSPLW
jgi:hypothetical protein